MIKKYLLFLIFLFLLTNTFYAQSAGPYTPLNFANTDFKWNHTPIDSSMIGYEDSISIQHGFSYDGRSHFIFDTQKLPPIFDKNFVYVFNTAFINFDAGGYIVEKIDLNTGELIWKTGKDMRTDGFRDHPKFMKIVDERLILFIYREFSGAPRFIPFPYLLSGIINTKLVRVEIDMNTGMILEEFVADKNDPETQKFTSANSFVDFNKNERNLEYYKKRPGYTVRITTSDEGKYLYEDTLRNPISNLDWENIDFDNPLKEKIISCKDTTYLLDVFIPDDSVSVNATQIVLSKYNNQKELVFSKPILESIKDSIGQLFFHSVTDANIYLRGYRFSTIRWDIFYVVLNHEGELVQFIDANPSGFNEIENVVACMPKQADQKVIIFKGKPKVLREPWRIEVFTPDNTGRINLKKQLLFDDEDHFLSPVGAWYLDNGDILFHLIHGYYDSVEDEYLGRFNNWLRITPEELGINTVSTKTPKPFDGNVSIFPNPTSKILTISTEDLEVGKKEIFIFDSSGKLIKTQKFNSKSLNIDVSQLTSGAYFLILKNENSEELWSKSFIKN